MQQNNQPSEIRVSVEDMRSTFLAVLLKHGMSQGKAALTADVFTDNSVDGVYSHGINRFTRFIQYIRDKLVLVDNDPTITAASGAMEHWNGNQGAGPTNALAMTDRAVALAHENGISCVTLSNTNHWMRGGLYGWKAASHGCIFIGWTNTIANMPAWGGINAILGNNPLVMALPYQDEAIVLDMAMSQFSYGALEQFNIRGQQLPVAGGYNASGAFTTDPADILATRRLLPMGYWKGAGLALLLDILAAVLSGGQPTATITRNGMETSVCQVFICIDPSRLTHASSIPAMVHEIIEDYQRAIPGSERDPITFPGQRVLKTRIYNRSHGIPVSRVIWDDIQAL